MAVTGRYLTLQFDREIKKVRLGEDNWVAFKGCRSKLVVKRRIEEQKKKDDDKPPPTTPEPTDRDGYIYPDCNGTGTYHYQTTTPPYTDYDLGVDCSGDPECN